MTSLPRILQKRLKGGRAIAIVGIGSELMADDRAGLLVAQKLLRPHKKKSARNQVYPVTDKFRRGTQLSICNGVKVKVFLGGAIPENLTGEIKKFKPTHVILIDAIDAHRKPGTIIIFDPLKQATGISFSSHRFPLSIFAEYLRASCNCAVIGIGIQPKRVVFSRQVSPEVKKSMEKLRRLLQETVSG